MTANVNLAARAALAGKRERSAEPEELLDIATIQFVHDSNRADLQDVLSNDLLIRNMMLFAGEHSLVQDDKEWIAWAGLEMAKACIIANVSLYSFIEAAATPSLRVYRDRASYESDVVDYRTLAFVSPQLLKTFQWNFFKHLRPFDVRGIGLSSSLACRALKEGLTPESLASVSRATLSAVVALAHGACDERVARHPPQDLVNFIKAR